MNSIGSNRTEIAFRQIEQQDQISGPVLPSAGGATKIQENDNAGDVAGTVVDSFSRQETTPVAVGTFQQPAVAAAFAPAIGAKTVAAGNTAAADRVAFPNSLEPRSLEQPARQLAAWLDVSKAMSRDSYNKVVNDLDNKGGFYMQAVTVATAQRQDIDKKISELSQKEDADPVQMAQLQKLRDLADGMIALYGNLSQASSAKEANRAKDSETLFRDLITIQDAIAGLDPNILGPDVVNSLHNSVGQIAELAMAFPTIETNANSHTPSRQLGVFFVMTFRRLRQINDGSRVRSSETNDMAGALKTYENDARDCTRRMAMFAGIREKVVSGHITDEAVIRGMLRECIKGAPALSGSIDLFAKSYANLAAADIHRQEAQASLDMAQRHLGRAQAELGSAQEQLLLAQAAVNGSSGMVTARTAEPDMSQVAKQKTIGDAKTMREYASECHVQAGVHIENFFKDKNLGEQYAEVAQNEAVVAGEYLNVAAEANEVIKAGSYGEYFRAETAGVDRQIATSRENLAATYYGSQDVKGQFSQLDKYALSLLANQNQIATGLAGLDAGIGMVDLIDKTDAMSQQSIKEAYSRLTDAIFNFATANNVKVSADLWSFLENPTEFLQQFPEEEGNVHQELKKLLGNYPTLAEIVARNITDIRDDFQTARHGLEVKLRAAGQDPAAPQIKARLDSLESSLINGLLNQNPFLFSALIAGSTQKTNSANGIIGWVQDVQKKMTGHMVADANMRQSAIRQFDNLLATDEAFKTFKENIHQRALEYGPVQDTECLSVYMSDTGALRNMNVYIFQKDGKYYALDPMTNNLYKGVSKDAAMRNLAESFNQVNGQVGFVDNQGNAQTFVVSRPSSSLGKDIAFGTLGVVGSVLLLIPEPTTITKFAGYGCIAASSAYVVSRGTNAIIEQVSHDNFDLQRKESREALFDVVSGLLTVVGTAGGELAKTGNTVIQAGKTAGTAMSTTSKLGKVAITLDKFNTALSVSGNTVGLGENVVGILTDNSLSDAQKADAIIGELDKYTLSLATAAIK